MRPRVMVVTGIRLGVAWIGVAWIEMVARMSTRVRVRLWVRLGVGLRTRARSRAKESWPLHILNCASYYSTTWLSADFWIYLFACLAQDAGDLH